MDEDEEGRMEEARQWSSFLMDDALLTKDKMKEKLTQLQEDLNKEFDMNEEKIFAHNFIFYLHWRLGHREKALAALRLAEDLEKEPNLITHCNEVILNKELEDSCRSKKLLDEIYNNIKHEKLQFRATAEIGYYYSRLGPQHHDRAVQLFKKAITGIAPERNILWEFRLALTLRRQTHIFQMTAAENYRPREKNKEAARLLYEILKFPTDEYCRIKARAWCEMSKTLFREKNLFEILHTDRGETEKINENQCFQEAMKLCPDEYFVLQEYGAHLRYIGDLEKSKEMLERSIQLRDTTFARHHLALTLRKMVEKATPKPNYRRNLQFSFSLDERCLSKLDSQNSSMSSMQEPLVSLSLDSEQTENKSIHDDEKFNRTSKIIYERSKSTGSVGKHEYNLQTKIEGAKANAIDNTITCRSFCVPKSANISKSPLKFHCKTDNITGNQQSNQKRKKMPFYKYQSESTNQKRTFISKRKSPRSVCISRNDPLLLQAEKHLQKAIEMCQGFDVGRYDLGLIYRMLDKPENALPYFSLITSNNCGKPSEYKMSLINAYEQQAICKLDLISKETDPGRKEELKYDTRISLWKALTITSGIIGFIPLLKTTNQCFPTLKMLLQREEKSFKTSKELAKLYKLLDYDEESIKFYKQMIEIECDSTSVKDLAHSYVKIRDFDNAICTLALLQGYKELDISDKLFYVDTCVEGAKDSLRKLDLEMAKIRFLNAFRAIFSQQNVSASKVEQNVSASEEQDILTSKEDKRIPAVKKEQNVPALQEGQNIQASKDEKNVMASKGEHDDNPLDILVLHSCGEVGCRYLTFVMSSLESFVQLKCSYNDNDCPPPRRRMKYLIEAMCKSHCIMIILHEVSNFTVTKDEFIDRVLEIALVKHRTKTLKIRKEGVEQDETVCKEVILPCHFDENVNHENSLILKGDLFSDVLTAMSKM